MTTEDKMPIKSQEGQNIQQPFQKENNSAFQQGSPQDFQLKSKSGWAKLIVFSILAICIGGLIGGGAGYLWGQSSKSEADIQRSKRLERAEKEAKDTRTGFITDKDRVVFTWTLKDLGLLSYNNKNDRGLTADQIVNTYGLASSIEYEKKGITLSWRRSKSSKEQSVSMFFEKVDGNYYLKSVYAYELSEFYPDENSEDEDENDIAEDRNLTTEEYKSLRKGNVQTGKGGTSLAELLKKHRQSVRIETERDAADDSYKSTRLLATVSYKVDGDYKTMRFLAQPNGDFLYIGSERY